MKKKFYKMLCVLTAAVFCTTAPAVVQAAQNEKQTEAAQEEEIEELKFFNIAEVELDNISPPIRPVVKRFIEQNS